MWPLNKIINLPRTWDPVQGGKKKKKKEKPTADWENAISWINLRGPGDSTLEDSTFDIGMRRLVCLFPVHLDGSSSLMPSKT